MFAIAARRAGLPVVYLGADLPLADWIAAVERTNARAVVIGALMNEDRVAARSLAAGLRGIDPSLVIAFGGASAPDPDTASVGAGTTLRLPDDMRQAVAILRASTSPSRA